MAKLSGGKVREENGKFLWSHVCTLILSIVQAIIHGKSFAV